VLLLLERILPKWNLLLLLCLTRLLLLCKRMLLLLLLRLLLLHDRKSKIHSRLLHSRCHERSNPTTAGRR
jgi:hypothetical protein